MSRARPWRANAADLWFPAKRATFSASGPLAGICMSWRATMTVRCSSALPSARRRGRLPLDSGLLRFDENHTVGAAAAVHRRTGRILEHLDGFDIVWTEPRETAAGTRGDRNVVDDVERLAIECK